MLCPGFWSASKPEDVTCVTVGVYCVAGTVPPLVAAVRVALTFTFCVMRLKLTTALDAYGIGVAVGTGVKVGWPGGAVGCAVAGGGGIAVGTFVGSGVWPGLSVAVAVGLSVAMATGPVGVVVVVPSLGRVKRMPAMVPMMPTKRTPNRRPARRRRR